MSFSVTFSSYLFKKYFVYYVCVCVNVSVSAGVLAMVHVWQSEEDNFWELVVSFHLGEAGSLLLFVLLLWLAGFPA